MSMPGVHVHVHAHPWGVVYVHVYVRVHVYFQLNFYVWFRSDTNVYVHAVTII